MDWDTAGAYGCDGYLPVVHGAGDIHLPEEERVVEGIEHNFQVRTHVNAQQRRANVGHHLMRRDVRRGRSLLVRSTPRRVNALLKMMILRAHIKPEWV